MIKKKYKLLFFAMVVVGLVDAGAGAELPTTSDYANLMQTAKAGDRQAQLKLISFYTQCYSNIISTRLTTGDKIKKRNEFMTLADNFKDNIDDLENIKRLYNTNNNKAEITLFTQILEVLQNDERSNIFRELDGFQTAIQNIQEFLRNRQQ